jgi:hypothetical protein
MLLNKQKQLLPTLKLVIYEKPKNKLKTQKFTLFIIAMAITKITKEKLQELVMEEVGKDAELKELFGKLFGKSEKPEEIRIDNVVAEKTSEGTWWIKRDIRQFYKYPRPFPYYGKVNIFPDGLMIFSYYEGGSMRNVKPTKQFKVASVERAVKYVADMLKTKKAEEERKKELDRIADRVAERSFNDELT